MKNQFIFRISLLLLLGAPFFARGQAIDKPWEIGFGGGINWQRARLVSRSESSDSWEWWIFSSPASTTTEKTLQSGNKFGYQGGVVISFHPQKRFSLLSGLNFASVESHAVRNIVNVDYYSNHNSIRNTEYQIDKEYLLLEVPLVFRWYVAEGKNVESPAKLFLDFGMALHFPIIDNSMLTERVHGGVVSTGKVGVNRYSYQLGFGLQVKKYALTYSLTALGSDDFDNRSRLKALTLVRYFSIGK
jgi:hypothetical protein